MSEERQRELLKWLERMEEFAAEERVKTRLLDAMEDCRKALERELTEQERQEIIRKLEELYRQEKDRKSVE